jgi:hypothetical protein
LSIKYLSGLASVVLHPALLASKDTLVYLALYNHKPVDEMESTIRLKASVPSETRASGSYMQPSVLLGFVKLLLLPVLKHISVRDFGGCPETNGRITPTHFGGIGEELNTNRSKDGLRGGNIYDYLLGQLLRAHLVKIASVVLVLAAITRSSGREMILVTFWL